MTRALLPSLLLLGAVFSSAQSPLDWPRIGYLVDSGGALRPLHGTTANFILGEVLFSGNTSCASSAAGALVKTPEEVILIGANGETKNRWAAPGGDALFAFHVDGAPALVFYQEGSRLMRVVEDRLETVPLDVDRLGGAIVAIAAPDGAGALLAVARGDEVWLVSLSTESGEVTGERLLAGVKGRVHLAADGSVLYMENGDLVCRGLDGAAKRFTLEAEVRSFAPLGSGWVSVSVQHAGAEGLTRYGLRLDAGREGLYQLPEVAQ